MVCILVGQALIGLYALLCSMQRNLPLSELSSITVKHVRHLTSPADDSYNQGHHFSAENFALCRGTLFQIP